MTMRDELERNLRTLRRAGYRVVLAPPLDLGGAGIMSRIPAEGERQWQGVARPAFGDALLEAVGSDVDDVVAQLAFDLPTPGRRAA